MLFPSNKYVFQVQLEENGNVLEVKVQHYGDLEPAVRRHELFVHVYIAIIESFRYFTYCSKRLSF